MTAPRTSFDIPFDPRIVDQDGNITPHWRDTLSRFSSALTKLRKAADDMDQLAASPTTTEIATAWNELRTNLREIV